jgi:hypothetical protein
VTGATAWEAFPSAVAVVVAVEAGKAAVEDEDAAAAEVEVKDGAVLAVGETALCALPPLRAEPGSEVEPRRAREAEVPRVGGEERV